MVGNRDNWCVSSFLFCRLISCHFQEKWAWHGLAKPLGVALRSPLLHPRSRAITIPRLELQMDERSASGQSDQKITA